MYSKRHFRRGTKARLGQQRQWPVSGSTYTYGNLVNFKGCFHIIHTERLNSCFLGWFLKNDKTLICPQTHSLCFPTHKSKNVEHHLLTFVKYWRVHQSSKFEVQVRSTNVPPKDSIFWKMSGSQNQILPWNPSLLFYMYISTILK